MSTMIATFDLPTENPRLALSDPARDVRAELRPWRFWGTLGWGLFAVATALFAVVVYTGFWMLTHQLRVPDFSDAAFGIVAGIVASVAPVIVLVIAVKSRQYPSRGYFALGRIPRGHLVLGIACLIALIVVFEAMERLLGIDAGSESVVATYRAAKLAGCCRCYGWPLSSWRQLPRNCCFAASCTEVGRHRGSASLARSS